ncbi:MAG TPA: DinB family protein [Thermoanaerobaculia bacterium]|nr:DinB family protein [Thermoanaerobaculia bacterium]
MTMIREFFIKRWEAEQPAFRKVLAALPGDKLDYRPHERSSKAGDLAFQIAEEQRGIVELLETLQTTFEPKPHPPVEGILKVWDDATEKVRAALANSDEEKWSQPAKFIFGGNPVWEDTLQNMLWGYLFDMIHHRGQLSAYLRPMGGKVPSIYGPSADDQGS